ncbi:putative ABC transport system, membrane protein [Halobacteriovorax marinus SJ]|uniref:ABC transport system, membrane protein n=1 Tax=Halobacteriovorax marinus (strain ATCC BAA-682 / DSM 15412 / SJ) TaxID=862908 RepID=E1X5H5_HALMS|nr:ABC transporter ATP-binding protein [Halobacteriovorax marinus]CBW27296.1 putative ABC transport system, membrane protein [Halobacteriovorax marinus SJ]
MKKRLDVTLLQLLKNQFIEFFPWYVGAFIALYCTHYIQSELPFMAKELADFVMNEAHEFNTIKFAYLALGIIVFRTSSRLLFFYPARILQKYLRVEAIERIESSNPIRYKKFSAGQLFQVVGNDLEEVRALIGFALLQVANIVIAMSVLVPKLSGFSPKLLMALTPVFVSFVIFTIIVSRNKKYYRKTQDLQGEVQNFIMEAYTGKKTIKNYHVENSFIKLFKKHSMAELYNFYKAGNNIALSIPLVPFGVGVSLLWGAHIIKVEALGASSLVLFSGFVFLFLEPMMFLSWIGVVFARSAGAWSRIKELINAIKSESKEERELLLDNKDSSEGYRVKLWDEKIDLKIVESKWNVLIGTTGCGKSEVIKQMANILMSRGKKISYVAQDPYLYNDSVRGNIFLGTEVTEQREKMAHDLLKLFGLDYLESSLDKLLDLEVGENGKRLSGGQCKRLCLIRSLMSDAEIIIWDDPFSSVDLILEKQIFNQLKESEFTKGRTFILSSHRLTTVKLSDYILYLDKENGLMEYGEQSKLLASETKTYEYFENQMV